VFIQVFVGMVNDKVAECQAAKTSFDMLWASWG